MKRLVALPGWLGSILLIIGWLFPLSSPAAPPSSAWLGVFVHTMGSEALDDRGLDFGVRIGYVIPDSPADEAGLKKGDIIVRVDDRPIYSPKRLAWLMGQYEPGDEVTLEIYRDGKKKLVTVQLGKRPRHRIGFLKRTYLGVKLQTLNPALRKFFGAPEDQGVLIAEVHEDSPAAEAGLQVGDVILKMDRKIIRSIRDVYRVLDFFEPGDEITVEILRDKKKQKISVILGEREAEDGWFEGRKLWGHFPVPDLEYELGISPEELEELKERLKELQEFFREWTPEIREQFRTLRGWWEAGSI
ncbi:MAG: PDZ domain-containing protein [Calditrichaeota bacterium]|nr:PDZ domain-containing protein [Calditrichota bacterium]